jgi:hypothetical protein
MFITRAIEKGVDVKVIAEWQGPQLDFIHF